MPDQIVGQTTARYGSKCPRCRTMIDRGDPVFKIPTEGKTTAQGQGPGMWVGKCCVALEAPKQGGLFNESQ